MKNFITALLVFLVWSFFGLWLYSWLDPSTKNIAAQVEKLSVVSEDGDLTIKADLKHNQEKETIYKNEIIQDSTMISEIQPPIMNIEEHGLKAITEDGDLVFHYKDGIEISKNSRRLNVPSKLAGFTDEIYNYLLRNPDKEVHIISLYSVTENNESPNLGIQRGKEVKRLLQKSGVPSEKIVVKSVIQDIDFESSNTFDNTFSFAFRALDQSRIDSIVPEIPDAIVVYPRFEGTRILENSNLKNLVDQIQNALNQNANIAIEIIGHTDNIGAASENYKLGLDFARQVRWYLISKGVIDKDNIKAISKGESESIDTNNTKRGRATNQRIEVVFY